MEEEILLSPQEIKSLLLTSSKEEIYKLEQRAQQIIDSHSDKELDEMTEYYLVVLGLKYADKEAYNRAVEDCAKIVWSFRQCEKSHTAEINEELQKLKK